MTRLLALDELNRNLTNNFQIWFVKSRKFFKMQLEQLVYIASDGLIETLINLRVCVDDNVNAFGAICIILPRLMLRGNYWKKYILLDSRKTEHYTGKRSLIRFSHMGQPFDITWQFLMFNLKIHLFMTVTYSFKCKFCLDWYAYARCARAPKPLSVMQIDLQLLIWSVYKIINLPCTPIGLYIRFCHKPDNQNSRFINCSAIMIEWKLIYLLTAWVDYIYVIYISHQSEYECICNSHHASISCDLHFQGELTHEFTRWKCKILKL
jgi:hypothetical protein